MVTLGPLPETDVTALVTAMVGAPPGDAPRRLTAQAAGNPLYVRELVDALVREQALQIRPTAEVALAGEQLPVSLAAVPTDRLSSVSAETAQMLRIAALLGGRFTGTDLAVVLRRPLSDLAVALQEAAAAGILPAQVLSWCSGGIWGRRRCSDYIRPAVAASGVPLWCSMGLLTDKKRRG